jgi:hypothetical protein
MKKVVACRSSLDYAASLLDAFARGGALAPAWVPLLCAEPGDDLVRLALSDAVRAEPYEASSRSESAPSTSREQVAALAALAPRDARAPACVVLHDDPLAVVGAAHAALAGKRLVLLSALRVLETEASLREARSITLVASPLRIAAVGTDGLRDAMARLGSVPWGILTASSPSRLSNLVARLALRAPVAARTGRSYPLGHESDTPVIAGLARASLPPHPSAEIASLASPTSEGTPFAGFVGHGRSYCAMMGNLCSRTDAAAAGDSRCMKGYECPFTGFARTPARDVRADVVFCESCSTSSFNLLGPERDEGMNLSVHMTDGFASAVIAPARTTVPLPLATYLAWDLLASGASMGETCARLNAHAAGRVGAIEPYLLLGDPEMQLFDGERRDPALVTASGDGVTWSVAVVPAPASAARYLCKDADVVDAARRGALHPVTDPELAPHVRVEVLPLMPGADGVELLAVWSADAPTVDSEIILTSRAPFREGTASLAARLVDNARFESRWLASPARAELEHHLAGIEGPVAASHGIPVVDAAQYAALYGAEEQTIELCDRVASEMFESLLAASSQRGIWAYDEYVGAFGVVDLEQRCLTEPCVYCGSRVEERVYRAGLWPSRRRRVLECAQCLMLWDVEDGAAPITIEGPTEATIGEPFELRVRTRNAFDGAAIIHSTLAFDRIGNAASSFAVEPRARGELLPPGGEHDSAFRVLLSDPITAHSFHVKGLALVNGSFAWAMRKIMIRRASRAA